MSKFTTLSRFCAFLLLALSLGSTEAKAVIYLDAEVIFVTSATCGPCQRVHRDLVAAGLTEQIPLRSSVDLKTHMIHVKTLDITRDETQVRALGLEPEGTPAFYIRRGDTMAGPVYLSKNGLAGMLEAVQSIEYSIYDDVVSGRQLTHEMEYNAPAGVPIVLIGTGASIEENPLFTSSVLQKAKEVFTNSFGVDKSKMITLYGAGPDSLRPDTLATTSGFRPRVLEIRAPELKSNASFTLDALSAVMLHNFKTARRNVLYVISGHGSHSGFSTWDQFGMTPELNFKNVIALGCHRDSTGGTACMTEQNSGWASNAVAVTGACHSGVFAKSFACGFFGARPDSIASGCWTHDPEKIRDYASLFLQATAANPKAITFEQAHWQAYTQADEKDVPYDSIDGLAFEFSIHNSAKIPQQVSLGALRGLEKYCTEAEKKIFEAHFAKASDDTVFDLSKFIEIQRAMTEQKNVDLALNELGSPKGLRDYQLVLRVVYRAMAHSPEFWAEKENLDRVQTCEQQKVSDFLK